MNRALQTKGDPNATLKAGHGRIQCALDRTAGVLSRYRIDDMDTGLAWSDGRWDFHLAVELDGQTFSATSVAISEGIGSSTMVDNSWQFILTPCFDTPSTPACDITLELRRPASGDWLEERLMLRNTGTSDFQVTSFRAMLSRSLSDRDILCFPVPFESCRTRPQPVSLRENETFVCSRDGAILLAGNAGLIIARHPRPFGEEPLFAGVRRTPEGFSFAGIAEAVTKDSKRLTINAGGARDWGVTRYFPCRGSLEDALPRYRAFMAHFGIKIPANYSPPIDYCVSPKSGERQDKVSLMQELQHAAESGCTLIHLGQDWEDRPGSGKWDATRLGKLSDFVTAASARHLRVGLPVGFNPVAPSVTPHSSHGDTSVNMLPHTPLNASSETQICQAADDWQTEKITRLKRVAKAGIGFFNFDFSESTVPCCDQEHGHTVPLPPWEHSLGVAQQQLALKQSCPSAIIASDNSLRPGPGYWPIYGFAESHDEHSGFDFMPDPFADFVSGHLFHLYYLNLGYDKPLRLCIDLRNDSTRRVAFWYVASTARHLGISNYAGLDDGQKSDVRLAVQTYRNHQEFFALGRFSGPDPLTHIHLLPGKGAMVLKFNDQPVPCPGRLEFMKEQVGCQDGINDCTEILNAEAKVTRTRDKVVCDYVLKAHDVLALVMRRRAPGR